MMSPMERCRWWSIRRDTIGEKGGKTLMVVQGVGHHRRCAFRGECGTQKGSLPGEIGRLPFLGVGIPV